jgi:hypothetical protein
MSAEVSLGGSSGRRRPSQCHYYADPLGRHIALNALDLQTCFIDT